MGAGQPRERLCLRRLVAERCLDHLGGRGRSARYRATGDVADVVLPELGFLRLARAMDAGHHRWDGRWRLLAFSIPERERARRDELRRRLAFLGGGIVQPALYASPHPWEPHVRAEAERLGALDAVTFAVADTLEVGGSVDPKAIAQRLWPLAEIAEDHRRFGARLDARLTAIHARDGSPAAHALGACVDLARATAPDPLLPPELLPAHWPGTVARDRFTAALAELLALADHAGETVPAIVRRVAAPRARV